MPSLLGAGPGMHYKSLKIVNQSLKHKVDRYVLSLHLNKCKLNVHEEAQDYCFTLKLFSTSTRHIRQLPAIDSRS